MRQHSVTVRRTRNGTFEAGQGRLGGRGRGTPNRVTAEVRQLARRLFDDAYWQLKYKRLHDPKRGEHPAVERELLAHAYGKPKDGVDVTLTDYTRLSPEELRAKAESLVERVRALEDDA